MRAMPSPTCRIVPTSSNSAADLTPASCSRRMEETSAGLISAMISAGVNDEVEKNAAFTAAALMAQNNVWYPYVEMAEDESLKGLPAQLRMNAISAHGGTTKAKFEAYSLASSIIGKCHFCVKAHYETLKEEGYTVEQLRDIGRISATINALSKILSA